MKMRAGAVRLAAMVAVTLIGAGACGPEAGNQPTDTEAIKPAGASQDAGAGATPTPDEPEPTGTPSPSTEPSSQPTDRDTPVAKAKGCRKGSQHGKVEPLLRRLGEYGTVTVDGVQSPADCKAIKKFQRRFGISPATGIAGPTTLSVARRLVGTDVTRCDTGKGLTLCVDLTRQTVWGMRGGEVVFGPTVTRTGMGGGFQTPAGVYHIGWRNRNEWSNPYKVWLPYWQQFHGGMGFHETTTYIHNSFGSHGCVNLLPADAKELWGLSKVGTRVHVFGRRPGT